MSALVAEGPGPYSIGPSACNLLADTSAARISAASASVVWCGFDTVYIGCRLDAVVFGSFLDRLRDWKTAAQGAESGTYLVPDADIYMQASGVATYNYRLVRSEVGEVLVTTNPLFGRSPVRVRLYSEFVARCGNKLAVAWATATDMVEDVFGLGSVEEAFPSELHFAIDFMGYVPRVSDWISRAFQCKASGQPIDCSVEDDIIHSFRWAGAGRPCSVALYNKTKEIREQSPDKIYFEDMYRVRGWSEERGDVYRLELRVNRDGLREAGVNKLEEVDHASIVRYFMGQESDGREAWVTCRVPSGTDTSTPWRWAAASWWLSVRDEAIALFGTDFGLIFKRDRVAAARVEKLVDMIGGLAVSVAARMGQASHRVSLRYALATWERRVEAKGLLPGDLLDDRREKFNKLNADRQALLDAEFLARCALSGA